MSPEAAEVLASFRAALSALPVFLQPFDPSSALCIKYDARVVTLPPSGALHEIAPIPGSVDVEIRVEDP